MSKVEVYKKKSAMCKAKVFDCLSKEEDFIEVTEWHNGEGIDVTINTVNFQLSHGQLEGIIHLKNCLTYNKAEEI